MGAAAKAGGGLRNVVAGESRISSIDGERGVLAYAGIDIHALAEESGFDGVWTWDHLRDPDEAAEAGVPEAWTVLTALAEATRRSCEAYPPLPIP